MLRALAASALLALVGLPGCGGTTIDSTKLEETLRHNLEAERSEKVSSIDCPSGQAVEPKAKFKCIIKLANGKVETATIEIRDKDADVSVIGLEEKTGGGNE